MTHDNLLDNLNATVVAKVLASTPGNLSHCYVALIAVSREIAKNLGEDLPKDLEARLAYIAEVLK